MTSGKKARQGRAPAPPPVRSTGAGRKASPKVLAAGAIVIAVAAVGAALAFALTGNGSGSTSTSSGTPSKLPDAAASVRLFRGIPQHGNVLGKPNAPVTMVEYIDLQCPICRVFETEVMPSIIRQYVRTGKLRVVARPLAFINPAQNSQQGRLAALAAGKQNRFFDFAQLLYANQGEEGSDWLNDAMIRSAYASIPGFRSQAALALLNSSSILGETQTLDQQATTDQIGGTPTVLVGRTGGTLTKANAGDLAPAIQKALNS
jgi:protein-disulfide isomerase